MYGFKILYGPPILNPEILFIGYKPGGDIASHASDIELGSDKTWPPLCEYAVANWLLAKQIRQMFLGINLKNCMGLNAIFMRTKSVVDYEKEVSLSNRLKIRKFCMPRVKKSLKS